MLEGWQSPPSGIYPNPKSASLFAERLLFEAASNTNSFTYSIVGYNFWMEDMFERIRRGEMGPPGLVLTTATPDTCMAYVSKEDYARACACALARADLSPNTKYDVSGPCAVQFGHFVELCANATGTPIRLMHVRTILPLYNYSLY